MLTKNNLEIRKFIIDKETILKEKADFTIVLDFLISQNFQMYLKERNISYIENYEIYYSLFSDNNKDYICNNGGLIYSAYFNNEIVGVIYINDNFYIDSLFVKEKYRKKGIGKKLIKILLHEFRDKEISITSSKEALEFYRKLNFIEKEPEKQQEKSIQLIYYKK